MIRFNRFANARSKAPDEQIDTDWPGLCDRLERLAKATAKPGADKLTLPAWTAAEMSEAYNTNANVLFLTSLPIDVDTADESLIEICEASCLNLFVYATPSDPNPDGTRRLRIVADLSRPILPAEVEHARLALAEHLGIGPGQGVETAKAVSQVMFSGRLHGRPRRETWTFEGDALDVDELMTRPLALAWKRAPKPGKVKALARVAHEDPDERTAALLEALADVWEAPGEATGRRGVLRSLGGYLGRRGWTDEQIAAVGRGLETERPEALRVATMVECAQAVRASDGDTGAGWSGLAEWSAEGAALIEAHAKDPHEPDDFVGVWSASWAAAYARPGSWVNRGRERREASQATAFAPPSNDTEAGSSSTPLLLHDARFGVLDLMWEGDARGYRILARNAIKMRVRELGYEAFIPLRDGNRSRTVDSILDEQAATFENTSYTFCQALTTYDPSGDRSVTVGFRVPPIAPRFDANADAWLRALGGPHYDRLAVWIASCSQAAIGRLAACVVMIGEKDSGKSMFGQAVGRMWGASPISAQRMIDDFNSELRLNPILVDEEAQLFGSRKLSTKKFRDEIQATSRSIQYKGKERVPLLGAMRLAVSCNGPSDLKFSDLGGPSVIAALADRLLVIDARARKAACAEALARLRPNPADHRVDLDLIAAHMVWLCHNVDMPAERFLGAGGSQAETAILAGHVDDTIDVWERFRDWLDSGVDGPWYALPEGLAVDTAALADAMADQGRGWEHREVRAALAPFQIGECRPRLADGSRPRLWCLDAVRMIDGVGLGADEIAALEKRLAKDRPVQPRSRFGRFK